MTPLSTQDRLDGVALLVLRLGLVWFIFLWAAHKIITPAQYQGLAQHYDGVSLDNAQTYALAGAQIAICLLALFGIMRLFSYGALLVMHFFTVTRRLDGFLDPFALNERGFPIHRNQVIDLAVLAAMIALILLIRRDNFSIGGWLRRRAGTFKWWM